MLLCCCCAAILCCVLCALCCVLCAVCYVLYAVCYRCLNWTVATPTRISTGAAHTIVWGHLTRYSTAAQPAQQMKDGTAAQQATLPRRPPAPLLRLAVVVPAAAAAGREAGRGGRGGGGGRGRGRGVLMVVRQPAHPGVHHRQQRSVMMMMYVLNIKRERDGGTTAVPG